MMIVQDMYIISMSEGIIQMHGATANNTKNLMDSMFYKKIRNII